MTSITVNYREHKNDANNDASPVFASIPIKSMVAVQQENSGCGLMGQLLGRETTITMTDHMPHKLQQLVGESHATDNISG